MTRQLNDVLANALKSYGIDVMFGVIGDANMYIVDSFQRKEGGRFVASANEGGGVLMASGYAAVTGNVGVATVTHGAIANCVSALFDASRGRYPLLIVAGDTARSDDFNLQSLPQRDIVAPTGAAYRQVRSLETVITDFAAALGQAKAERRPVVLEIPADFQQAEIAVDVTKPSYVVPGVATPSERALEEAAGMVIGARRPLVLGGRGVASGQIEKAVGEFAERIGAPLGTTLRGKGLFANDPFNIGIVGTLSTPVGSEIISRADCLIVFGAALSALTTLKGELLEGKRIIQVDTDPAVPGRYFPVDITVIGDAGEAATRLTDLVDEAETKPSKFRSDELAEKIRNWHDEDQSTVTDSGPLTLTGALHRVNQILPKGRSLVIDGGRFAHEALRIIQVETPQNYAHGLNIAHIGMGVGYGIGAAVGRPEQPSLVVAGDGGFMLGGLAEFNTAVRNKLDLVLVLINDRAYGAEYFRFVNQELDPALTMFDWPEFVDIATALGARSVRIEKWSDFDVFVDMIQPGSGPLMCEVVIDVDSIPDPGMH